MLHIPNLLLLLELRALDLIYLILVSFGDCRAGQSLKNCAPILSSARRRTAAGTN
jgi:hypothetical protein